MEKNITERRSELLCQQIKGYLCYLRGNHTRGLPIDEFNREFEKYIHESLSDDIKEAKQVDPRLRLELTGQLKVFSLLELTHLGLDQYAKSLAIEIHALLAHTDPMFGSKANCESCGETCCFEGNRSRFVRADRNEAGYTATELVGVRILCCVQRSKRSTKI